MDTKNNGSEIYLTILSEANYSPNYAGWMNDYEITRFLESRWKYQTDASVRDYIRYMNESTTNFLFGIFLQDTNQHIGNIKIGGIDWIHRYGDVGLLIGERSHWGKGYASLAILQVTQIAFRHLNLNKLWAGIYKGNEGSYKAFIKAGWRDVGLLKNHRYSNGQYIDEYLVEIIK
jgi:RimJ/RimL family protein N-acetyltransferase